MLTSHTNTDASAHVLDRKKSLKPSDRSDTRAANATFALHFVVKTHTRRRELTPRLITVRVLHRKLWQETTGAARPLDYRSCHVSMSQNWATFRHEQSSWGPKCVCVCCATCGGFPVEQSCGTSSWCETSPDVSPSLTPQWFSTRGSTTTNTPGSPSYQSDFKTNNNKKTKTRRTPRTSSWTCCPFTNAVQDTRRETDSASRETSDLSATWIVKCCAVYYDSNYSTRHQRDGLHNRQHAFCLIQDLFLSPFRSKRVLFCLVPSASSFRGRVSIKIERTKRNLSQCETLCPSSDYHSILKTADLVERWKSDVENEYKDNQSIVDIGWK